MMEIIIKKVRINNHRLMGISIIGFKDVCALLAQFCREREREMVEC